MNFSVIIVSGGQSSRMNGIDKQLSLINNIPVLIRSINAFDNIDCVNEIVIVLSKKNKSSVLSLLSKFTLKKDIIIADGGNTRQQSVINGFIKINPLCDYVAIHDGARPLVKAKDIENVFNNAVQYGASTLGVPVKDTIKIVKDGFIESTPQRSDLFVAQTPQVFEISLYKKALENSKSNNFDFTDDCQLVESIGSKVFMTIGSYDNIKITTPNDIITAETLLKEGDFN